jgi:type IV pilus biogenesis/stability protein PilW
MRIKLPAAAIAITIAVVLCGCPEDKTKSIAASKIAFDLGVNYFTNNQAQQALQEFLKAVKDNPEFPEAHNALGLIYFGVRDYKQAEEHYKLAIELKPDFSEAQNNLGRLYLDTGEYDKAIDMFKKAIANRLYRTPQYATLNLGWALYKKGKPKEAIEQFKKAVVIDQKFCLGYRSIGIVQTEQNESLEALRAFEKFHECYPADPEGYYRLAEVKRLFKLASMEDIAADLEKSLELNQAYCPARLMLGAILDEQNKKKEALETMEKYFDSCQESAEAEAYKLTGLLYIGAGQEAKGLAYIQSCAKKWPETPAGRVCITMLNQR